MSIERLRWRRQEDEIQVGGGWVGSELIDTTRSGALVYHFLHGGNGLISLKLRIRHVAWKRGAPQPGGPPLRVQRRSSHPQQSAGYEFLSWKSDHEKLQEAKGWSGAAGGERLSAMHCIM